MIELLKQALVLTGWGMGMTFLAIGTLVLCMYMLTMVIKDKKEPDWDEDGELYTPVQDTHRYVELQDSEEINKTSINDDKYRALAASVAVAIALSQESGERQKRQSTSNCTDAWNNYVRGQHVSQRSHYEQIKHHR